MGSEQANDTASFKPTEPALCANGCGFFGTAATMNLCSKCFRDWRMEEERAAQAKAAMEKSLDMSFAVKAKVPLELPTLAVADSSPVTDSSSAVPVDEGHEVRVSNKCKCCRKKVGLTGFNCRCGGTFCGSHRYPEQHGCEFDFKGVGRSAIEKANPVVKADKLEERV